MKVTFGELVVKNIYRFRVDFAVFINSRYVVSLDVVEYATRKAVKNWEENKRISRSLPIEVLLHYAATRQIKDALKLGIFEGRNRVAAVIFDESRMTELDFKEVKFKPEYDIKSVVEHYGITEEEIAIVGEEKIPMLVKERIALFSAFGE